MRSSLLSREAPSPEARARVLDLLLDAFAASMYSRRLEARPGFVDEEASGEPVAVLWFDGRRTEAERAALVNGTLAHHADYDDGTPRAGLHGGVTVIPAAVATAELVEASGAELIDAIAFGYRAAVAYGAPLLEAMEQRRVHPPSRVGCIGAAAASAHLLRLDPRGLEGAITLAASLMPLGPFESFTQGAPVKDLYGGFPAAMGVRAAQWAERGLRGPEGWLEPAETTPDEVLDVYVKPWPSCRSTHAALTALEKLLPVDAPVTAIEVETYRFASELSADADDATPQGGRTSIPASFARLLSAPIADKVRLSHAEELEPKGARVTIRYASGRVARAEVDGPRSEPQAREKLRAIAEASDTALERAVDGLADAPDVTALSSSLSEEDPRHG